MNTGKPATGHTKTDKVNQQGDIILQRSEYPYERGIRLLVGEMLDGLLWCILERKDPYKAAKESGVSDIAKSFSEILERAAKLADTNEFESLCDRSLKLVQHISEKAIHQARGENKEKIMTQITLQKTGLLRLLEALTDRTDQRGITAHELTANLLSTYSIDTPQKESDPSSQKKIPSEVALALLLGVHNLLETRPLLFQKCAAAAFDKPVQDPPVLTLQEFISFVGRGLECNDPKLSALGDLGGSPGRIVTLVEPDSGALIACLLVPKTSFDQFGVLIKTSIEERLSQIDLPNRPVSREVWDLEIEGTHAVGIRFPLTQEEIGGGRDAKVVESVKDLLREVIQRKTADLNLLDSHAVQVKLPVCESSKKIYMPLCLLTSRASSRSIVKLINSALTLNPETEDALALSITRCTVRSKDNANKKRYEISWEKTPQEAPYLDRLKMLSNKGTVSGFCLSGSHVFISLSSLHRANERIMSALTSLSSKVSFGQVDPISLFYGEDLEPQVKIFECLDKLISKFLSKNEEKSPSSKPLLFLEMSGTRRDEICVYLTDRNLSLMARGTIQAGSENPGAKLQAVSADMSQRSTEILSVLSKGIPDLLANSGRLSDLMDLFKPMTGWCNDNFIIATWMTFLDRPRIPTKLDILMFFLNYIGKDDLLT